MERLHERRPCEAAVTKEKRIEKEKGASILGDRRAFRCSLGALLVLSWSFFDALLELFRCSLGAFPMLSWSFSDARLELFRECLV